MQAGMRSSKANYVAYPHSSTGSLHHPHHQQMPQQPRGRDAILPAVLEFREDTESAFFNALTINLDPSTVNFKLAPTYTLYMATRYTVQKVQTEMGHERNKNVTQFLPRSLLNNSTYTRSYSKVRLLIIILQWWLFKC